MLREVKCAHIKPRIVPVTLTTAAAGVTLNKGYGDFTATRASAGFGTLTHRHGFSRNGGLFLSQGTADGGYVYHNSASGASAAFPFGIVDAAGGGNEGTASGFSFGFDSTDLSFSKQQRVAATIEDPRIIWGKITGATGDVAIGTSDFACTKTATGTYTVTFKRPFCQTPNVKVTGISASGVAADKVTNITATGCTVGIADENPTAQDLDFYITAIGSDGRSDSARGRMPLENSQRKPRILYGQITNAAGTPSLSIGGATGGADFVSLTDNGAGDFSVTIAVPFVREPAIFLSTTTQRCQVHSYSTNVIRILTKAAAGSNTDVSGVTGIFVIGSDDSTTY